MNETMTTNDTVQADAVAMERQRPTVPSKKPLSYFEEKLRKARFKLAEAKAEQAKQAKRDERIREREIGRITLQLIEQGRIDPTTVATLLDAVKKSCRKSHQASAFAQTIFE